MRVLFISNRVFPSTEANGKIVENIGRALQQVYNIESDYITIPDRANSDLTGKAYKEYTMENHNILQINSHFFSTKSRIFKNKSPQKALRGLQTEIVRFLSFDKIDNHLIALVNEFIKKNNYECIIFVSYPHKAVYLINKIAVKTKKIWILLDSFTSYVKIGKIIKKQNLKLEKKIYENINSVFLPKLVYNENMLKEISKYKVKMNIFQFPNIIENTIISSNKFFSDEHINIVFVGFLYPDIRNPKFLLDLLSSTSKNIKLYIIGGVRGNFELNFFENYKSNLGDRFEILGKKSQKDCLQITNEADILVNIGNTVPNFLPSKIFDYISTGKPILNICKLDNCPTLEYMEKYNNCLNIFEKEGINTQIVEKFENFCISSKDKKLPFHEIKETFKEATLEYVVNQLYNSLID